MKKLVLSMLIGLGLITTGFVKAEPMGKTGMAHKEYRQERHLENLKTKLNLCDEQFKQIKEIKKQEKEEIKNFFKNEHKNPLIEATKSGNFDKETFQKTMLENAKKMSEIKAKYMEKMFNVLNDEQKKKFIDLMNLRMEKMHKMMQND